MSVKDDRNELGVDIINSMSHNGEFPFEDMYKLAHTMMEYFASEDFEERLKEYGYTWRPSDVYWQNHLKDVRETLRKKKSYLEFVREQGSFKGLWKFVKKTEFVELMARERKGIETRIKSHNDVIEDAKDKWQLPNTPKINILLPFDEFAE